MALCIFAFWCVRAARTPRISTFNAAACTIIEKKNFSCPLVKYNCVLVGELAACKIHWSSTPAGCRPQVKGLTFSEKLHCQQKIIYCFLRCAHRPHIKKNCTMRWSLRWNVDRPHMLEVRSAQPWYILATMINYVTSDLIITFLWYWVFLPYLIATESP